MREIEFRAYIKDIKKTVNVLSIDFFQENIGFMHPITTAYTYRDFKEIEFMQYTGLKDKNGTKIFEGDIVNWYGEILVVKFGEHDVVEQSYDIYNHFRNVDKFGWFGERQNRSSKGIELILLKAGEVIGNIYDNHELLEV